MNNILRIIRAKQISLLTYSICNFPILVNKKCLIHTTFIVKCFKQLWHTKPIISTYFWWLRVVAVRWLPNRIFLNLLLPTNAENVRNRMDSSFLQTKHGWNNIWYIVAPTMIFCIFIHLFQIFIYFENAAFPWKYGIFVIYNVVLLNDYTQIP